MDKHIGLSKLIEQYKNTNLLSDFENGLKREHSEYISLNLLEMNPICSKYFIKKEQYAYLDKSFNNGIVEPILVRKKNGKYQVVTGFKRFLFAKKNKIDSIPAIVEDISDDLMLLIVIDRLKTYKDENILNKAYIYNQILIEYNISRNALASLLGVSISQVTNTLRILKLSDCVKKAIKDNKISYGHAKMMVGLNENDQERFLNLTIQNKLSVRQIEKEIYDYKYKEIIDYDALDYEIELNQNIIVLRFKDEVEAKRNYKIIKNIIKNNY